MQIVGTPLAPGQYAAMGTMVPSPSNITVDRRRNGKYQPGQLVTSVLFDQSHLKCWYCCQCCCSDQLAEATAMDVYTNGVMFYKPRPVDMCCCNYSAVGEFRHFDDRITFSDTAMPAEMCAPFPFCFADACGCYGEALALRGQLCTGASCAGMKNQYLIPSWGCMCFGLYGILCCTPPITVMYGLSSGEALRAANVINTYAFSYRNSGRWAVESQVASALSNGGGNGGQTGTAVYGAVAVPTSPYSPQQPVYAQQGYVQQQQQSYAPQKEQPQPIPYPQQGYQQQEHTTYSAQN